MNLCNNSRFGLRLRPGLVAVVGSAMGVVVGNTITSGLERHVPGHTGLSLGPCSEKLVLGGGSAIGSADAWLLTRCINGYGSYLDH